MSRRARLPAAERRESILRAAAEVFAQAGYRAGKVSDVAARVGVTEPVIFQNFGSASELLAHVLTQSAYGRPGPAAGEPGTRRAATEHAGAAYGVLFADAAALAAEPELADPAQNALRSVAAYLADLIRRAQTDGGVRADTDPEAASWLLLSVLSARRMRAAAMPAGLEPAVTALALQALAPPMAAAPHRGQRPPEAPGTPGTSVPAGH